MKREKQKHSSLKHHLKLRTVKDLSRHLSVSAEYLCDLAQTLDTGQGRSLLYRSQKKQKKSGGIRKIDAPTNKLKWVLKRINTRILQCVQIDPTATGGIRGKKLIDNVKPHVGKPMVAKFDLENFFPSISSARVYNVFQAIGCAPDVAHLLTRLTTVDGRVPQGSPTSSMLAVLVTAYGGKHSLNGRLRRLAAQHHSSCTTWVDDITISGPPYLERLQPTIKRIAGQEGFTLHPNKSVFRDRDKQQVVTGVVVNAKPSVPRKTRMEIRSLLHACKIKGPRAVEAKEGPKLKTRLRGKIAHIQAINTSQGESLLKLYKSVDWSE